MTFERLIKDEEGSTTLCMVISLLIAITLIFTSAQVYRINTTAAEVQDVADAAALAAENQVAEFMIAVQLCDAVVLSLSLLGLTATGLGVVALCIPPTASLAKNLIEGGRKILEERDAFAERASKALDRLQEALPFIAAVSAAQVASGNSSSAQDSTYQGIAILINAVGKPITIKTGSAEKELVEEVDHDYDHLKEKAAEADEAARKASESKQRAYLHDCGNDPSYCMYERAEHLAGLSGTQNPFFASVDTWSFSIALERARIYYRTRYQNESANSGSVNELARSALRKIFYQYANEQMASAYVRESDNDFEAYFPHLPRNTQEMRRTHLYTDSLFPYSETDNGDYMMHAWSGCPEIGTVIGMGSIAFMESKEMPECPACSFSASSLGKVAAASTSIENGFEYHYEIVATEAENYQKAYQDLKGPKSEIQNEVTDFLNRIGELIRSASDKRIEATPPGRYGAIAVVINNCTSAVSRGFENSFVETGEVFGPRIAVSAATLVGEKSDEGRTVINSLLDGLSKDDGVAVGALQLVLQAWSFLLHAYTNGNEAIESAIKNTLDRIPLIGPSGLGTWAAKKFTASIEGLGLQPAELRSFKAVLVNSAYVAESSNDSVLQNYVILKRRLMVASENASDALSLLLNDAQRQAIEKISSLGDSFEIASIELLGPQGVTIPIVIPLPKGIRSASVSFIESIFAQLQSLSAQFSEGRVWR